jgi:hypothetical protein
MLLIVRYEFCVYTLRHFPLPVVVLPYNFHPETKMLIHYYYYFVLLFYIIIIIIIIIVIITFYICTERGRVKN